MLKLYRRENGRIISYHEAWVHDSTLIEHWGSLGQRGSTREHSVDPSLSKEENIEKVLSEALKQGYEPIDMDDHAILLIEYAIEGMGTMEDLDKRHSLEDRMNETLGWTGMGNCDGGSIGSGTMEACCYVVDFETAKDVIIRDLRGTPFDDYSRIYNEGAE